MTDEKRSDFSCPVCGEASTADDAYIYDNRGGAGQFEVRSIAAEPEVRDYIERIDVEVARLRREVEQLLAKRAKFESILEGMALGVAKREAEIDRLYGEVRSLVADGSKEG